jgi:FkbH-like protein
MEPVGDLPNAIALLEKVVQVDAGAAEQMPELLGALRTVASAQGPDEARRWARRMVSPLLDYSSLNALHRFLPLRTEADRANPLRLAILGGPTTAQLRKLMEVFLASEGVVAEVYECDYGLFRQEILTSGSGLDQFQPQFVFLATGARDASHFPAADQSEAEVAALAEQEIADFSALWSLAHEKWGATIIQNNFELGPGSSFGHLALRHPGARENYLDRLNRLLAARAPPFVVLHDLRGLAADAGARAWFDARYYFEFKMPCGPECLVAYAHSVVSVIRALQGRSRKVLVLDLDNTLWGGVVGDVGPGGIELGDNSGAGQSFLAFQRYALQLRAQGIVLAVCSKNDADKAREPFETRSDMVLKLSDFASFVANWGNKADNLREIARELNLGTDSLVFFDDSPAERALVRRLAPEVAVPDVPEDPSAYVQTLAAHRYFETTTFTREDATRAQSYTANARRRTLAEQAVDLQSFLVSLGMRMQVAPVNALNLERVTQLLNKSNQFNLTTRRLTLAEVKELGTQPDWTTLTFSLRDNLGDNGLISVVLLRRGGDTLTIDTWIMSCRVLQRGVEQFVLNEIVAVARREGVRRIAGTYIPTPKNGMVEHHYPRLGFELAGTDGGKTLWTLPVEPGLPDLPHFIERDGL